MAQIKQTEDERKSAPDRLAIVGLIFIVIPPVGFILSVIAARRSAFRGKLSTLATIGTIANALVLLVGTIIIVSSFRNGRYIDPRVSSDKQTVENLSELHQEIQRYIKKKAALPLKGDDLKTLEGFDQALLYDAQGKAVRLVWSPEGCDSTTGDNKCTGYSLSAASEANNQPMTVTYDAYTGETFWSNIPSSKAQ